MSTSYYSYNMDETLAGNSGNYLDVFCIIQLFKGEPYEVCKFLFPN